MATPEELAQRQEAATVKVEDAAHILDRVSNGGVTETVPTINGPVPSVAKFLADRDAEIEAATGAVDRFCGAVASAPTTRLDASPLQQGDEYHNTGNALRYSWSGSAWVALNSSAQSLEDRLADSTDPSEGAAKIGRSVVSIESVEALLSAKQDDSQTYEVAAFHPGVYALADPAGEGGGIFFWSPNVPKTSHNGGTVIDPLRPWPADWSNETQKTAWYTAGVSGTGCFVRQKSSRVLLEEFGVSTSIANNSKAMQRAFDTGAPTVSYKTAFSWSDTTYIDTWGQAFVGPDKPGQYHTGRRITFNGAADTWGIHVRAPGCAIRWHDARGGSNRPNFALWFRNQAMIPGNADLDAYLEQNNIINFKVGSELVGRSAFIRDNLFSLHTTGVNLKQFIYTSGTPEYYQTLERGYRGFEFTENRFHASSGVDIRNMEVGHENLYGCVIGDNNHDTDGCFFQGSISVSTVDANLVHRLVSSKIAFDMYRCRNVVFSGSVIAGEIIPLADATFAAAAFKFNTKEVANVTISGGNLSNIAGIPFQFVEPPEGLVAIDTVGMKDVCYNARAGAQVLPIVDIANVSADGRGVNGFILKNCPIELQPITGGATYGNLVRFTVRGAANKGVDVYGNNVSAGGTIPRTNLVTSSTTLFNRSSPYAGNGSATQTITLPSNPEWVMITPLTSGATNRLATILVEKGSSAGNDLVELTETGVIVKGAYNTSGVVYSLLSF